MILASLLLAVELNGQQLSRGTEVLVTGPSSCLIHLPELQAQVLPGRLRQRTHQELVYEDLSGEGVECRIDAAAGIAKLNLAPELLRPRPLQIGRLPDWSAGLALLQNQDPRVSTLPSLALDLLAGQQNQTLGLTASYRQAQWSLQRTQSPTASSTNWAAETFLGQGGLLSLGDQVLGLGLPQAPTTQRGLSYTNRAQPLRQSQTHSSLLLSSPARLRFLDPNGQALYTTSLLGTGQYQVSGPVGSPGPGLLQVEVLGADGQRQLVSLPWTHSPLLLGPNERVYETFFGRQLQQLKWSQGLSVSETGRIHLEHLNPANGQTVRQAYAGLSSRRWSEWLLSADFGLGCGPSADCRPAHRLQSQWQWSRQMRLTLEDRGPAGHLVAFSVAGLNGHQLSLSLSQSASERITLVSWQKRLLKNFQFQTQLRQGETSGTVLTMSLHIPLGDRQTGGFAVQNQRSQGTDSGSTSLQASFQHRPSSDYGSFVDLTQRTAQTRQQSLTLRQEESFGSFNLSAQQADDQATRLDGQIASRLWITPMGFRLGRLSDSNLVIHSTGLERATMVENHRRTAQANEQGDVWFPNAPSWSNTDYRIQAKSLPFFIDWRGGQTSLATTKRRAYRVDHRGLWQMQLTTRLDWPTDRLRQIQSVNSREGRSIPFNQDGYLDFHAPADLPLRVQLASGVGWLCGEAHQRPSSTGELLLGCRPEKSDSQNPAGPRGRPAVLEAQTTEPLPSSG